MTLPSPTIEQIAAFRKLMYEERGVRLSFAEAAEAATELLRAVWVEAHAAATMEECWPKGRKESAAERRAHMFTEWDESSLRQFRGARKPPMS